MKNHLQDYLAAVQFFTRLPVTGALAEWMDFSPQRLQASVVHFPGVGLLVGMVACVVFALVSIGLPQTPFTPFVAAVISTAATALITGAFHEDGLADTADGLGGSPDRDRALEIMKDSRIGTFGAVALLLVMAAKLGLLALLASRSAAGVLAALLAGHVVSRYAPLVVIYTLAHVGDTATSKSKPLADRIGRRPLALAALWLVLPLAAMALAEGAGFAIAACAGAALALTAMHRWLRLRLQGFTGDGLGATQQVCEVAFYLGAGVGIGLA